MSGDGDEKKEKGSPLAKSDKPPALEDSADEPPDSFIQNVAALPSHSFEENLEGRDLGQYRIGAQLGRGGMGVVYRATDTALRRTVALKVLPADVVADPERRRRFLREARLAASIPHPNIAAVYEVGEKDGRVYLVMEFVEGETLRKRIEREKMDPEHVVSIASAIASGLAKAHGAGIVHRDLKPDNVMIRSDGLVKILDFGIAKLHDRAVSADGATVSVETTAEGRLLGTPAYMSPEQAKGRRIDDRTDVFSLGVVLYEMLTGQRPFRGETAIEVLIAIDRDVPTPPSKIASVPEPLEKIVLRCLSKDPAKRPDIHEFLGALDGLEEATNDHRTAARLAIGLVLAGGLTIGLVGVTIVSSQHENAGPDPPSSHVPIAVQQLSTTPSIAVTTTPTASASPIASSAPRVSTSAPAPIRSITDVREASAPVAVVDAGDDSSNLFNNLASKPPF